jgi:hypothetical protein
MKYWYLFVDITKLLSLAKLENRTSQKATFVIIFAVGNLTDSGSKCIFIESVMLGRNAKEPPVRHSLGEVL